MEAPLGRVTLNVGGFRYRTCRGTLAAFPGTKLSRLAEPGAADRFDFDACAGDFFFDRSGRLFEQVLHLCRSGHLHGPVACRAALRAELAFWGLTEARLPACCWSKLCPGDHDDHHEAEEEEEEGGGPGRREDRRSLLERGPRGTDGRWARAVRAAWAFLEEPRSSPWATGFAVLSLLFNVALIAILCAKGGQREDFLGQGNLTHPHRPLLESLCPQRASLLHLELFFILCFMCEFATRLVSCPDKKRFFRKALNVVDFLALFPVCLDLFFSQHRRRLETLPCWLNLFRVVYVLKLLKVLQLLETPQMLRVFPYMLRSILKDIAILLWVFLFEILFFGSLMLFADLIEDHPDKVLHDILSSFWFAVITLTTIGYGDIYPFQPAGKMIGACAVLCGLLTIIVPIPIFFIKFKHHYTSAVIKEKRKREEAATAILRSLTQ